MLLLLLLLFYLCSWLYGLKKHKLYELIKYNFYCDKIDKKKAHEGIEYKSLSKQSETASNHGIKLLSISNIFIENDLIPMQELLYFL